MMEILISIGFVIAVLILAYLIHTMNSAAIDYLRNKKERRKYYYEATHKNLYAPMPDCECYYCKRFGVSIKE